MNSLTEMLGELFRSHGVPAVLQGKTVVLTDRGWTATAAIVRTIEAPAGMTVQLDVRLEIEPGRTIIESFAGVGETHERAVVDALHAFGSTRSTYSSRPFSTPMMARLRRRNG